jgi:hypothetical protein
MTDLSLSWHWIVVCEFVRTAGLPDPAAGDSVSKERRQVSRAVVVHYHEIGLKGRNRSFFERALVRNLLQAVDASEHDMWSEHDVVSRVEAAMRDLGGRLDVAATAADAPYSMSSGWATIAIPRVQSVGSG